MGNHGQIGERVDQWISNRAGAPLTSACDVWYAEPAPQPAPKVTAATRAVGDPAAVGGG